MGWALLNIALTDRFSWPRSSVYCAVRTGTFSIMQKNFKVRKINLGLPFFSVIPQIRR